MKLEDTAVQVVTIGFTGKTAQRFFGLLEEARVQTVLDVRLHNTSQLAGFAKKQDLRYFLKNLCSAAYVEMPELVPEPALLKRYRSKELSWDEYQAAYLELLEKRGVEKHLDIDLFRSACVLCSEHLPHHCHRRIALEYLNSRWNSRLLITHLH